MSKKIGALALVGALALLLCGCNPAEEAGGGAAVYFLRQADGGALELAAEYPERGENLTRDVLCRHALAAMQQPEREHNLSALPGGDTVELEVRGAVAYVYLGEAVLDMTAGRSGLTVAAIALSLMDYGDISHVYIYAGGQLLSGYRQPFSRSTFVGMGDTLEHFQN